MIKPYDEQFSVDYSSEHLEDVFVFNASQNAASSHFCDDVFQVSNEPDWLAIIQSTTIKESLLIAANTLASSEAIYALGELADDGIQIFLLFAESSDNMAAIEALSGRCCIRTGISQSGMLFIADHHLAQEKWGRLCSSGFSEDSYGYSTSLEHRQVDDYYRLFCHLFWKQARYEYLAQGLKKECGDAPIANIALSHEYVFPANFQGHLGRSLDAHGTLLTNIDAQPDNKLWQLFDVDALNLSNSNLLLSLSQVGSKHMSSLADQANGIELFDTPWLPQIIITNNESWLLPIHCQPESVVWAVKLTENQKHSVKNYHFELSCGNRWTLNKDLKLSELNSTLRFSDSIDTPVECLPELSLSLGALECQNFEAFETDSAEELAAQQGLTQFQRKFLARQIRYDITVTPPYLPSGAKKDSLHKEWEDLQKQWQSQVVHLQSRHTLLQNNQQNLADGLRQFMGNFLTGQITTKRKTDKILSDLEAVSLAQLSPSHRSEKLLQINEISSRLLTNAEKLAEETDRAQQLKEWNGKQADLSKKIASAFQVHSAADTACSKFEAEKSERINTAETGLKNQWQDWLGSVGDVENLDTLVFLSANDISKWISDNSGKLDHLFAASNDEAVTQALKNEWGGFLERYSDNEALKAECEQLKSYDSHGIRQWLKLPTVSLSKAMKKSIQKLKESDQNRTKKQRDHFQAQVNSAKQTLRKMHESYEQKIKALERQEKQVNETLVDAGHQLQRLEEDLARHEKAKFSIKPKDTGSILGKLLGTGTASRDNYFHLSFPDQDLPRVGQLYQSGNKRYLAIRDKQDIEFGKQDAERLHADLVVARES